MMTKYDILVNSGFRVFNVDDLVSIWFPTNRRSVLESIKGYVARGKLERLFKGIYALPHYDELELAQKLFPPSYVTYLTALTENGIIFQFNEEIHLFGANTKTYEIKGRKYIFHKVKNEILFNDHGITKYKSYSIAATERAICDSLYINSEIGFDNLRSVNTDELFKISNIYKNKRLEKEIKKLISQID